MWFVDCSDVRGVTTANSSLMYHFRRGLIDETYTECFLRRLSDMLEYSVITENEYDDLMANFAFCKKAQMKGGDINGR